jgi:hypothetical protein
MYRDSIRYKWVITTKMFCLNLDNNISLETEGFVAHLGGTLSTYVGLEATTHTLYVWIRMVIGLLLGLKSSRQIYTMS